MSSKKKNKWDKLAENDFTDLTKYQVNIKKIDAKPIDDPIPHKHPSTHKKIEVIYRLANEYTEDTLEDLINTIKLDGIDIITVHSGYVRDPLGKNKETPE